MNSSRPASLAHCSTDTLPFAQAMLQGLAAQPKQTSPKWFYDARGSALFEQITELPEYYPTRTEIALLQTHLPHMVEGLGRGLVVVELGSGSSRKTPLLLSALYAPAVYAPIDISESALQGACASLRTLYPKLELAPVLADFTEALDLPSHLDRSRGPRLGFFPGSTLGNFSPEESLRFLQRLRHLLGDGSSLLLGLDTVKDEAALLRAYDDAAGVTADFNLNLLARMNRELGADFDLQHFMHEARWNAVDNRIEMHIVSRHAQTVNVLGERIAFDMGESIHTEDSYKYTPQAARALFRQGGWATIGTWLAPGDAFAFYRLQAQ